MGLCAAPCNATKLAGRSAMFRPMGKLPRDDDEDDGVCRCGFHAIFELPRPRILPV